MNKCSGFATGLTLYALLGIGLVVVGLGGYGAYQYQRAEASTARANVAEERAALLKQSLQESEATNGALRVAAQALDQTLVARDKRQRALDEAKRKLEGEINALKASLPKEDQGCLDRPLPPAIVERLRGP